MNGQAVRAPVEAQESPGAVDREFMRQALFLAERGRGRTTPNPLVGAVVVSPDGVVVGRGYHERAGTPHAEVHALRAAGSRAKGATLYCTLEPCCHVGRTGPCAPAIVDAGVARVVVAIEDTFPLVAGGGLEYLRRAGVEVTCGVRRDEAARQNAAFFSVVRLGRPLVVAKVAISLDGCVAHAPGRRTRLTGPASNREVQRLRAGVDAIAVGSGTVLADDPLLTARDVWRERPLVRVIFDRRLRTPPSARLFATRDAGPIVIVTQKEAVDAAPDRARSLEARGAILEPIAGGSLEAGLKRLVAHDVQSVLLEGGPTIHRAAWAERLIDRVLVYIAPVVLGEGAVAWDMPPDFSIPAFTLVRVEPRGDDVVLEAEVRSPLEGWPTCSPASSKP